MGKLINLFSLRNTQAKFMNNIEPKISNNLYEFYNHIAQIKGIHSEEHDHWSVIRNTPGVWPRIIYKIAPKIVEPKSAILFSEKVKSGT